MDYKRIFRCAVCLLLVFSLLISYPSRAEAVEPISSSIAIGVFAVAFAMAMGVVWTNMNYSMVEAIGDSMTMHLYQWGTSAEKLEEVEEFLTLLPPSSLPPEDDGDDGDDGDSGDNFFAPPIITFNTIPHAILAGLMAWVATLIDGDYPFFEDNGIIAPEGFAYYNGELFPVLPELELEQYPFLFINQSGPYYFLYMFSDPPTVEYSSTYRGYIATFRDSEMTTYLYDPSGRQGSSLMWDSKSSGPQLGGLLFHVEAPYWKWSNFDVYNPKTDTTVFEASVPVMSPLVEALPNFYVGDIPQKIEDGVFEEEEFQLGGINFTPLLQNDPDPVVALNDVASKLQTGAMTYEDYVEIIQTPPAVLPDPAPKLDEDTLAGTNPNSFLEELGAIIYAPFKWIWGNIKTFFEPLLNPEHALSPLPEFIQKPFEWLWGKIEPIPELLTDAISGVVTGILEGIKSLFVPSDGYIDGKVNDLCDEYVFADSIASTAKDLRSFLTSLGSKPPVIHIDLGASTGPYDFGGEMVFIDFSFYDPYKPVMDAILSAFLWLWFVWRVVLGLPGIISGMSGLSGANIDSSSVGVSGSVGTIATNDSMPKHTPQPGGDAHFREWLRNRNDAHYNEYHGRTKK